MRAPRLALWLVSMVLPWDRQDDVLGDLEELHLRRTQRYGHHLASIATTTAALFVALAFLFIRLREKDLAMPFVSKLELLLTLRLMKKQPVLTATSLVSLAVGIAVASVGFTLIDAALHSQLDVEGGERFVRFSVRDETGEPAFLTAEHYRLLNQNANSFEHVGAILGEQRNVLHPSGQIETVMVSGLTPRSLRFVPLAPLLGRELSATDVLPGATPVALIGERLWRRSYGARPEVLGERLRLGELDHEIVGVAPEAFEFPAGGEVWLPIATGEHQDAMGAPLSLFAILGPGIERGQAQLEVNGLVNLIQRREAGADPARLRVEIVGYTQAPGPLGILGLIGVLVPILVILVIAANIANLVQARTAARTRELSLRTVLGAPRSRLVGQLSLEAMVLGLGATVLGLGIAVFLLRWIDASLTETPFWLDLTASPRTFAYASLLALVIAGVCGVVPALRATRFDVGAVLGSSREFTVSRLGAAMMVTQMALSIALLSGALVMAQSLWSAAGQDLDLPDQEVLTAQVVRPAGTTTVPVPQRVVEALRAMPGVLAVGTADHLPRYDAPASRIEVEGTQPRTDVVPSGQATRALVSAGFLESLRAEIVAGRLLAASDFSDPVGDYKAPLVAVVNQPFVARFFGEENPLGQRFRPLPEPDEQERSDTGGWIEVVGVVPDLGLGGGTKEFAAGYYLPGYTERRYFYVSMLSAGDPNSLSPALRQALMDLDPDLVLTRVQRLELVNAEERAFQAGIGATLSAIGLLALGLSMLGLYAMTSCSITQRTREIGVRVALGASTLRVIESVTHRAGVNLALGALFGAGFGLAFVRLQDQMLAARLPAGEPWILPTVLLAFAVVGAIACVVPSLRALRIAPSEALKAD